MTIDEFLDQLKEIPSGWKIDEFGVVRESNSQLCPITALSKWKSPVFNDVGIPAWKMNDHYLEYGERLGLERMDAINIAEAADGLNVFLRDQLLNALQLKEGD